MNLPWITVYRLAPRGGGGLACDEAGVALGAAELVRVDRHAQGRRRCDLRTPQGVRRILAEAYGPQPDEVVLRIHRGLRRAASAIEAGELCLAGIETVHLSLPDLTPSALAKLAGLAALEKGGASWENQPRIPAGQPGGGEWTTEDGADAPVTIVSPHAPPSHDEPRVPLDDAVFRPGTDYPRFLLTGDAEEDEASRRSNGPPDDFTRLEDVFPGLKDAPALSIPLAPVEGFFGVGALAEDANLEATLALRDGLIAEIKEVDPTFTGEELLPEGGIAGLTWKQRTDLINSLRMERASAYYRMRGDVGYLQVETMRFLQDAVDAAYDQAVSAADAGRLQPRLSREEAIGTRVDTEVRRELKSMFDDYGIPYGPRMDLTINNRDYQSSENAHVSPHFR